jgi:uncharacterized membrane protein YhaH (DUF805 family)
MTMEWMLMPLKRYAEFTGRSRRKEYWMWLLFVILVTIVTTWLDIFLGLGGSAAGTTSGAGASFNVNFGLITILFMLATLVPGLAVGVRRLHDLDKSGWMLLIGLIPFLGGLYLLFLFAQPGTVGSNKYGPDPKGGADAKVFT